MVFVLMLFGIIENNVVGHRKNLYSKREIAQQ